MEIQIKRYEAIRKLIGSLTHYILWNNKIKKNKTVSFTIGGECTYPRSTYISMTTRHPYHEEVCLLWVDKLLLEIYFFQPTSRIGGCLSSCLGITPNIRLIFPLDEVINSIFK